MGGSLGKIYLFSFLFVIFVVMINVPPYILVSQVSFIYNFQFNFLKSLVLGIQKRELTND